VAKTTVGATGVAGQVSVCGGLFQGLWPDVGEYGLDGEGPFVAPFFSQRTRFAGAAASVGVQVLYRFMMPGEVIAGALAEVD